MGDIWEWLNKRKILLVGQSSFAHPWILAWVDLSVVKQSIESILPVDLPLRSDEIQSIGSDASLSIDKNKRWYCTSIQWVTHAVVAVSSTEQLSRRLLSGTTYKEVPVCVRFVTEQNENRKERELCGSGTSKASSLTQARGNIWYWLDRAENFGYLLYLLHANCFSSLPPFDNPCYRRSMRESSQTKTSRLPHLNANLDAIP